MYIARPSVPYFIELNRRCGLKHRNMNVLTILTRLLVIFHHKMGLK